MVTYADGLLLLVRSNTTGKLASDANTALQILHCWGSNNKLSFNPNKTIALLVSRKHVVTKPNIFMNVKPIKITENLPNLGVTLDRKMTFSAHLNSLQLKANKVLTVFQ